MRWSRSRCWEVQVGADVRRCAQVCRSATWGPRRMRTHGVVRAPFPSLPAYPSLSIVVRQWVGSQGRDAFLSHYSALERLRAGRGLHRESDKGLHGSLPGNAGRLGPGRDPGPTAQPLRENHSRHAPVPRPGAAPRVPACPAPGLPARRQACPPPLIGSDCGRGGVGQRAADSRWRRPGGGHQPSRRKGQSAAVSA